MLITQAVRMDLLSPGSPVRVNAVQGEKNTRGIAVEFFTGDTPWPVPENVTVALRYMKSDGSGGCYDSLSDGSSAWSIHENVITMLLADQMLTVPGIVSAQLELSMADKVLVSYLFYIVVEGNPAENLDDSENYVNLRQWMQGEMNFWLEQAKENGLLDGKTGQPAVLENSFVHYQTGTSGMEHPVGEWSSTVPAVEPGEYLWVRTTFLFNSGDPVVTYSVSRFGADGGQDDAIPATVTVSRVLTVSGWTDTVPYMQTVAVNNLSDTLYVRAYPDWPEDNDQEVALAVETAKVSSCRRDGVLLTFKCREEKPNMDIPVILEVYA